MMTASESSKICRRFCNKIDLSPDIMTAIVQSKLQVCTGHVHDAHLIIDKIC